VLSRIPPMPICQNLRFTATVQVDSNFERPPGAMLMRRLLSELTARGWIASEMDNWRDCGWFAVCRRASSELTVVLNWVERGYWILQISPWRTPGFIQRMLGGKPSAAPSDVQELALAVQNALSRLGYLDNPRWRWDGFPDETHSTSEPQAA